MPAVKKQRGLTTVRLNKSDKNPLYPLTRAMPIPYSPATSGSRSWDGDEMRKRKTDSNRAIDRAMREEEEMRRETRSDEGRKGARGRDITILFWV